MKKNKVDYTALNLDFGTPELNRWFFSELTEDERHAVLRNGCQERDIPPLAISGNDPMDYRMVNTVYKPKGKS